MRLKILKIFPSLEFSEFLRTKPTINLPKSKIFGYLEKEVSTILKYDCESASWHVLAGSSSSCEILSSDNVLF